jgi:uncharacterized repeat protein (TIGR01451 family)
MPLASLHWQQNGLQTNVFTIPLLTEAAGTSAHYAADIVTVFTPERRSAGLGVRDVGSGGMFLNGLPPYATSDFINQIVSTGVVRPGEVLTYTIILRNPESFPLTQIVVQDTFDPRLTDVQLISNSLGTGVVRGNTLTVSGFTLKSGQSIIIEVSAVVGDVPAGVSIPNVASFTSPDTALHISNAVEVQTASERLPSEHILDGIGRFLPVLIGVLGLGGSRNFSRRRRQGKGR